MPGADPDRYRAGLALASGRFYGGPAILRLLKTLAPEEIWQADEELLVTNGMLRAAARKFIESRLPEAWRHVERSMKDGGLGFVAYGTQEYPEQLVNLPDPPAGLFFKGDEEKLHLLLGLPRVTVVGTRRASHYGSRAARDFAEAFASRGVAVVSGMALGIDARSHEAALEAGALTVAVLGCGADVVYPPRHRGLYQLIVEKGLVFSELPPGAAPATWTFPHRNRLLAALGDAVVVVEGAPTSGAMQTADHAISLGRPVFAVPGSIHLEGQRGCNLLVRDGATPALDPAVTVEEFLLQTRIERGERRPPQPEEGSIRPGTGQDPFRELVASGREGLLELLAERPLSIDGLVLRTGLAVRHLSSALAELELAGLVSRAGPGLYIRAP
jgi:DNA processing protein